MRIKEKRLECYGFKQIINNNSAGIQKKQLPKLQQLLSKNYAWLLDHSSTFQTFVTQSS
ncbi:hypothetical protein NCCP28_21750 [Niallia sp. NCCP-28]|nr:hypothetical protein NCCP28_21750 [Niallia sp. NCCP-28]